MGDSADDFDIEQIKQNALAKGIALGQSAIVYKDLTDGEKAVMQGHNLITDDSADSVIARFTESGEILFKEKARSVLHLSA